jgi:hypothetical protein
MTPCCTRRENAEPGQRPLTFGVFSLINGTNSAREEKLDFVMFRSTEDLDFGKAPMAQPAAKADR